MNTTPPKYKSKQWFINDLRLEISRLKLLFNAGTFITTFRGAENTTSYIICMLLEELKNLELENWHLLPFWYITEIKHD